MQHTARSKESDKDKERADKNGNFETFADKFKAQRDNRDRSFTMPHLRVLREIAAITDKVWWLCRAYSCFQCSQEVLLLFVSASYLAYYYKFVHDFVTIC